MDILQPDILHTGVNLTTFRFRYEGSDTGTSRDDGSPFDDYFATVHDSLLTLYQGVRLGGCQWAGDNLLATLAKVSIC